MNDIPHSDLAVRDPGARFIIDGENIPFGAYQAIYHKITQKTEKTTQIYNEAYTITFSEIHNLHERLEQGLKQYRIEGSNCEIVHSIKGGQSKQYSSFEKFRTSDVLNAERSREFSYSKDFLIVLPAEIPEAKDIPQRYKLNLLVRSNDVGDVLDTEDDFPTFVRFVSGGPSILLSIEYADYAVMAALKSIVDNWVKSLPCRKKTKFVKMILRNRYILSGYMPSLIEFIPIMFAALALWKMDSPSLKTVGLMALISVSIAKFSSSFLSISLQKIEYFAEKLGPSTFLIITKGDENNKLLVENSPKSKLKIALYFLASLVTIAVNILSSFIFDVIK